MADKGRDLTARFLTDLDQFKTEDAARGLDDVGRAADGADRKLDGLGSGSKLDSVRGDASQAEGALRDVDSAAGDAKRGLNDLDTAGKDAGSSLDRAATDADEFADKLRDAFNRASDAADKARKGTSDVGDGVGDAKEKVKEFGAEGTDTAREVAASFDGSASSIVDGFQEVAANAAAVFGPVGLAVGVAAAAGLGYYRAEQEKNAEGVKRLTAALQELASGQTDADQATKDYLDGLDDQAKTLKELSRDAQTLGLDLATVAAAHAGNAAALELVATATDKAKETARGANAENELGLAYRDRTTGGAIALSKETQNLTRNTEDARAVTALYDEALGKTAASQEAARAATEAHGDTLASFVDPASEYTRLVQEMAQQTADKTADQKDSWEDYAKSTDVSLDAVNKALEAQVTAQEDWASNMTRLAGRVSDETLEYLSKLGPEGAPLVQKLVDGSDEEMIKFEQLMARRSKAGVAAVSTSITEGGKTTAYAAKALGEATAQGIADGLVSGKLTVEQAASQVRDAVASKFKDKITALVEIKADPNSISYVRQEAAMAARYKG